ncbi:MAG TPA: universal stress protein [Planctomycetota bacterium]|jgi:nucleotide-binding universal stress UspA family protein|nr:universal stress protein [Planctomycetota bacterium]
MSRTYRTVLCPTDLSPTGDDAAALACALAGEGATVHLLHVCEPAFLVSPLDATPLVVTPSTPEGQAAIEKKAVEHLRRITPAAARNVRVEHHVVHEINPAAVIDREARRLGCDVIVLGTHGRTGLGRVLMGSVATDVLRRSKVPVVLFHAGKAKE